MFGSNNVYYILLACHTAIIDIDGNSWSSRFGMLLCSNSVVIKVRVAIYDEWRYHVLLNL